MAGRTTLLRSALLVCAAAVAPQAATVGAPASALPRIADRTIWDGVFTDDQAARGEESYFEECAACHGRDLAGGDGSPAPSLAGDAFFERYTNSTVADLFERMRATMPLDSPARLSRQRYADLVAYLFKANRVPAGARELEPDLEKLREIGITKGPAAN